MSKLPAKRIDPLIRGSTFHLAKAFQIHEIAARAVREFAETLACDADVSASGRSVPTSRLALHVGVTEHR